MVKWKLPGKHSLSFWFSRSEVGPDKANSPSYPGAGAGVEPALCELRSVEREPRQIAAKCPGHSFAQGSIWAGQLGKCFAGELSAQQPQWRVGNSNWEFYFHFSTRAFKLERDLPAGMKTWGSLACQINYFKRNSMLMYTQTSNKTWIYLWIIDSS